jgi:hypothetical protein
MWGSGQPLASDYFINTLFFGCGYAPFFFISWLCSRYLQVSEEGTSPFTYIIVDNET